MTDEELLTVDEVAKQLRVHSNRVRAWIKVGDLIAIDLGRDYRISRSSLDDFLKRRQTSKKKKEQ